jgi:hypothetical protein
MRSNKVILPSFWSRIWSGINSVGESRKSLKALDPPVKPGDDDITTLVTFPKDLFIIPIYNKKLYYSAFIPALKSGVFC